jgi:hypothetical protein
MSGAINGIFTLRLRSMVTILAIYRRKCLVALLICGDALYYSSNVMKSGGKVAPYVKKKRTHDDMYVWRRLTVNSYWLMA